MEERFDIQKPIGDTPVAGSVAALLRSRLMLVGVLVVVVMSLVGIDFFAYPERYRTFHTLDYVVHCFILGLYGLLLLYLWRQPTVEVASLRAIEVLYFGVGAVVLCWGQVRFYHSGWLQEIIPATGVWKLFSLLGDAFALPWLMMIVLYGVCIPNTGRRCALVVLALALMAVLVVVALAVSDAAHRERLLVEVLSTLLLWLGIGVAVAVYGSHKINVLQFEALQAKRLGQYVLKRLLGKGGMGEVHLAEHLLLRRPCAIKLIRPETVNVSTLRRFQREVQATAALTHPGVVEIYDFGHAADGTFYYVMEYLEGMNLDDLVRAHGPLPPARVIHLMRQLCAALREAHACGLVHRDVKPANIVLCERGRVFDVVKLLDFGLVREVFPSEPGATQAGMVVGTPLYMSPEQAAGSFNVDARSDLYSLGLVAYFLLTGKNPFRRSTPREMLHAHLRDAPPALLQACPAAGPQLAAVIMRCLEKEPRDRYADVDSLERALAACPAAGVWTAEQAEDWWRQVARWAPRRASA